MIRPALRIAVIGAGWAGCAAGVELADLGHDVTLIEATRFAGGRARAVVAHHASDAASPTSTAVLASGLDNGQHILLGAYSETLASMKKVGVSAEQKLLRLPLQICYPPHSQAMQFEAAHLPAPFHLVLGLIRAKGLERGDKTALVRFASAARWMDWTLHQDCSVAELLQRFDQTDRLVRLLWTPLCLAALNTPPERASAKIFLNVLRDSLGARRRDGDMLLPRCDLSELFPVPAMQFIQNNGGRIVMGSRVVALRRQEDSHPTNWQVHYANGKDTSSGVNKTDIFDAIIVATSVAEAKRLMEPWGAAAIAFPDKHEAITTCYLQYDRSLTLSRPFYALEDNPALGNWGQFVFDRGQLDPAQAGLLATVTSTSSEAVSLPQSELALAIAAQLSDALCNPALRFPINTRVISEKRATFSCTPDTLRPTCNTGIAGLYLAGDYVQPDYPGTIESAVRSGRHAAALADRQAGKQA